MSANLNEEEIRIQPHEARVEFHQLLNGMSEKDFQRQSLNHGWTNGEILAHITFGFIVINGLLPMARLWGRLPKGTSRWFAKLLDALTVPFNWVNALGAREQGRVFTHQRIGRVFDRVYFSLVDKARSIKDDEWDHGMHYPTKWDENFDEFMTLEKLFHYPVIHFKFHLQQIAR